MSYLTAIQALSQQSLIDGTRESKSQVKDLNAELSKEKSESKNFSDYLKESLATVNAMQQSSDQMATNLATGKTENIHETMLAISQAEVTFKLMVQVRNKALEAYQEVMRMPV